MHEEANPPENALAEESVYDIESSSVELLSTYQKVSECQIDLAQFFRLFVNKLTLFTKLEALRSKGVISILFLPVAIIGLVFLLSPKQHVYSQPSSEEALIYCHAVTIQQFIHRACGSCRHSKVAI